MRIQDLFSGIQKAVGAESEPITSRSEGEGISVQKGSETQTSAESKLGIANSSDQFETFKPGLFDSVTTAKQRPILESTLYSNEKNLMPIVIEDNKEAKSVQTVLDSIWRSQINENVSIPFSPAKIFQTNLEYYLTGLANDSNKFHGALSKMYGENYDAGKAEILRKRVLGGDFSWLPKVETKSNQDLNGHFAAVDPLSGSIYVNESKHQPFLHNSKNAIEKMSYSSAYGQALWSAMRRELDPADASQTAGRSWGVMYVNGNPRNVEWIDTVNLGKISAAVNSIRQSQEELQDSITRQKQQQADLLAKLQEAEQREKEENSD